MHTACPWNSIAHGRLQTCCYDLTAVVPLSSAITEGKGEPGTLKESSGEWCGVQARNFKVGQVLVPAELGAL